MTAPQLEPSESGNLFPSSNNLNDTLSYAYALGFDATSPKHNPMGNAQSTLETIYAKGMTVCYIPMFVMQTLIYQQSFR